MLMFISIEDNIFPQNFMNESIGNCRIVNMDQTNTTGIAYTQACCPTLVIYLKSSETLHVFDQGLTKVYLFIVTTSVYISIDVAPTRVTETTYVYSSFDEDSREIPK